MEIEVGMMVERPVAETFQAFDSAKAQITWMGSLVEVEMDPSTPWGKGARFTQTHVEAGMRQVFQGEMLDYVRNQRLLLKLVHNDLSLVTEVLLVDLGERTQVQQRSKIELHSTALKIVKGMVRGAIEQRFTEDLQRLKTLLEND